MNETIECLYSCTLCGLRKVRVDVPLRTAEEDVKQWMDKLGETMSLDHMRRSPGCCPESLSDVMIPYTGRSKVVGPVEQ